MALPALKISEALLFNPQVLADSDLAWRLQAEEYKQAYHNKSGVNFSFKSEVVYQFQQLDQETQSFTLRETAGDRDCFFHAVNLSGFDRKVLVKKLLECSGNQDVLNVFAHEIRQFLYLGYTGNHPDGQENEACKQLLTTEICDLFSSLINMEEKFRQLLEKARTELGALETRGKKPKELLLLLKAQNLDLAHDFGKAYEKVLETDKSIEACCARQVVFENYIHLYLDEALGYIPFSRDLGEELPKTTIDVINQLFGLNIQIYLLLNQSKTQLKLANRPHTGTVIPIFHNGINHFWGLVSSSKDKDLKTNVLLKPLPTISYDREELDEIIEELEMSFDIKDELSECLKYIEKQVLELEKYQTKRHPENFYQAMRTAVLNIRNTATAIYELTKNYHQTLPNTLKELILKWITPLEAELEKRIEMPVSNRDELDLKTKHLYAEQSFISRQESLQQTLMQHLERLKGLLLVSGHPAPRCYISYAWPSEQHKAREYWVQPFLFVLYDHLKAAGIRVVMDIRDNNSGDSIYQFMKQYHEGNYIILVGTESLLEKHYGKGAHAVQTELGIINDRFEQDQSQFGQNRIYPMLISGTMKSAYPEIYDKYRTVRDTRDAGYVETLKKLIDWIYEASVKQKDLEYRNLWQSFCNQNLELSKESSSVEQELSLGYHRKQLEFLRQDTQYQAMQAQEQTPHSQAVQAEQIGALIKSQGSNPQLFYDANGFQFQRPYTNPDFIMRQGLWDKMTSHFEKSDQQILTLTAHGLGGMGKTELAQYYYRCPPRPYTLRAWFHAETKEHLYQQYVDLAAEHPKGMKFPKETPIEEKVKQIKKWLESQKDCLLIYDNVPDNEEIEALLPIMGKHHILITSRNAIDWPVHQMLDVDVMEKAEAIVLICKITGFREDDSSIKQLVEILGYLPLALAQAGAYMAAKSLSIKDYLNLYQDYEPRLLTDKPARSPKHEPIWITFDINFEALEKDCPKALETLKQASWLAPSAIPEILLLLMVNSTEDKRLIWNDIKEYIKRYSLMRINTERKQLSIHPLLQDIVRLKQDAGQQLQYFKQCSKVLNDLELPLYQFNLSIYKTLVPHAEHLHERVQKIVLGTSDIKTRELLLLEPISLGMFYLRLHLNQLALKFLIKTLSIYERHYGQDHVETAAAVGNLGTVYSRLGKLQEARAYDERALKIKEQHYGKDHVETTTELVNLGTVYLDLGRLQEARAYYERALTIQEQHYGQDHLKTAESLGNLGIVYRQLGKLHEGRAYSERALEIKEQHYGKDHVETTASLGNLGTVYLELGKLQEARAYDERALKIKEQHYGKDHVETAGFLGNLGTVYLQLGRLQEARAYSERALKIDEQHYGKDHVETAAELGGLGNVYLDLGKLQEAQAYYERALTIQEQHYGKDHVETTASLGNLGIVYLQLGRLQEARAYYERALKIKEQHYGQDHIQTATSLGNLGTVYLELGKLQEARAYYERALKIKEQHYGQDHVGTAVLLGGLGTVYQRLGKLQEARAYYERALKIKEQHYGKDHVERAAELGSLGNVYRELGKLQEARAYYERALKIDEQHYGKDHVKTAASLGNLGTVYLQLGKLQEARVYYERALKIDEQHYGQDHVQTATLLGNLGTVYLSLGKLQEAQAYYERALTIQEQHYGKDHVETARTLGNLGMLYQKLNKFEDAIQYLQHAKAIYKQNFPEDYPDLLTFEQALKEAELTALSNISNQPLKASANTQQLNADLAIPSVPPLVFSRGVAKNESQEQPSQTPLTDTLGTGFKP